MKTWKLLTGIIFTLGVTPVILAGPVTEYNFKNGLKLLVKEDHRAPVAVSSIWYKVGSSYEPEGITGISHALEHMMFRGSKAYPGNALKNIIAHLGGEQNATTSDDQTVYYQTLPANKLEIAFKLEADRMQHLQINPSDFEKEIQVVMEERRMRVDDDPQGLTWERFMAALHVNNPYHHMSIGWMNDIKNMTPQDIRHWYEQWYKPNNAIIIVVGDVQPEKVAALAKLYFEGIPMGKLPILKPRKEIPSLGTKVVTVNAKATIPLLILGYQTPSLVTAHNQWEAYALDVLAAILGGTNSSRLTEDLVRKQVLAIQVSADYDPYTLYENQLAIMVVPAANHSIQELKKTIFAEIKKLQNEKVSVDELDRIKTQVIADDVYSRDSLYQQAMKMGTPASIGLPWQYGEEYVSRIEAVTPEQIQQVAKEFLTNNRLTVAILKPIPATGAPTLPTAPLSKPGDLQ